MKMFLKKFWLITILLVFSSCSQKGYRVDGDSLRVEIEDEIPEVSTFKVTRSSFNYEIVCNGKVFASQYSDLYFSLSQLPIIKVFVKEGEYISSGMPVAQLDTFRLSAEVSRKRNTLAQARLEMKDVIIGQGLDPSTTDIPEEVRLLAEIRSGYAQALIELRLAERDLEDATLRSPMAGIVANLSAKPHNLSNPSKPVCRIISTNQLEVVFMVLETELPFMKQGTEVSITPFSGGKSRHGYITMVNPMVEEDGMVKVTAAVDASDSSGLIDGMNVRISVRRSLDNVISVPKSAVVLRSGKPVVFTLSHGKASWHYVTLGPQNMTRYVIEDGLEDGMDVIISGNVSLAHDAPVTVKE